MRNAAIYKFGSYYIVHPESTNRLGLLAIAPPYARIPVEASPKEVATQVWVALQDSRDAPPPPGYKDDRGKGMLQLAELKSWSEFDPLEFCRVEQEDDGSYVFVPQRRVKAGHGPVPGVLLKLAAGASVQQFASMLVKAMAKSGAAYRSRRRKR